MTGVVSPRWQPIVGRKLRFALVGCGRISASHIDALAQHAAEAELTDVCDTDPQALAAAVEKTGARGHASLEAMLASTTADIVCLTTPSGLHARQAMQVAQSGRHVLTEKPMATRWEDGLDMVQACEAAGVQLFVVKQNRLNATLQLVKRAFAQGRFGRIYMVGVNVFWTRPQSYYDAASWRGTWALDGGAFMNQASHYVDLLDWLVGPVHSLNAFTATLARNIEAEDTGVMNVRWKSGALGSVSVTMLTYPRNLEGSITILGERGTVRVGGVAVNQINEWTFADSRPEDIEVRAASYETASVYGYGHVRYFRNVIEVLRGHELPETDGHEGLRSLGLLVAAYQSARENRTVEIDSLPVLQAPLTT